MVNPPPCHSSFWSTGVDKSNRTTYDTDGATCQWHREMHGHAQLICLVWEYVSYCNMLPSRKPLAYLAALLQEDENIAATAAKGIARYHWQLWPLCTQSSWAHAPVVGRRRISLHAWCSQRWTKLAVLLRTPSWLEKVISGPRISTLMRVIMSNEINSFL